MIIGEAAERPSNPLLKRLDELCSFALFSATVIDQTWVTEREVPTRFNERAPALDRFCDPEAECTSLADDEIKALRWKIRLSQVPLSELNELMGTGLLSEMISVVKGALILIKSEDLAAPRAREPSASEPITTAELCNDRVAVELKGSEVA